MNRDVYQCRPLKAKKESMDKEIKTQTLKHLENSNPRSIVVPLSSQLSVLGHVTLHLLTLLPPQHRNPFDMSRHGKEIKSPQ
jgi:hypothetical protein